MRFLLLSTDYPDFLNWLYSQYPGLENECYEKQVRVRAESLFSGADFYSTNLQKLGHEAWDIDANNKFMQKAWARQHGVRANKDWGWEFRLRKGFVPWLSRVKDPWFYHILAAQIKYYKPDVLLNHSVGLGASFFREMKPYVRLLVGSHGSPLPEDRDFGVYDLVLSVVENFVDYFRQEGVNSELLRLGFEPLVLERLNGTERSTPVSFVGQLSRHHASRQYWLEYLCQQIPVQVWAPSTNDLRDDSPVIRC